jgi:hypothetical protein
MLKAVVIFLSIAAVFAGTLMHTDSSDVMKWLEKLEERVKVLEERG